jgi:ribonuclease-3
MNYERLEFLGDAMLSAVIAAYLYNEAPAGDEGYLTKMRSKIVSREHLNELGRDLNLIRFVESKVPTQHFGENIHGNIFEALVGAIFLDKGYDFCQKFEGSSSAKTRSPGPRSIGDHFLLGRHSGDTPSLSDEKYPR